MVIGIIENTLTDGSRAFDVALVTEGRSARWPATTESDAIAFALTLRALIEAHTVALVPDIWGLPAGEVLDGLSGRKEKMLPALNELPAVEEARGSSIIKAFSPALVRTLLQSLGVVSPINLYQMRRPLLTRGPPFSLGSRGQMGRCWAIAVAG